MIEEMLEPLVAERFRNEPEYRAGHVRIINALPGRRILGVHVPEMRALAKELSHRSDALEMIAAFEREAIVDMRGCTASQEDAGETKCRTRLSYEETVVWGLMINYVKVPLDRRLELVRRYVPYMDNWAVCDLFDSAAKWVKRERKNNSVVLWDLLCGYFASEREFEVRFAVVMAMSYFIDEEWLPEIFRQFDRLDFGAIRSDYISSRQAEALASKGKELKESAKGVAIGEPPYYVRMAVAWCLATALAKFPDMTRAYMKISALPDDVRKLYARKARESFRTRDVSPF